MIAQSPQEVSEDEARTALLWDLDNVAPPRQHLASFAWALSGLVAPDEPVIAAGHRLTFRACRPLLATSGFRCAPAGDGTTAPDRALLREARTPADQGFRRFLVASNDHRFARIAAFANLPVPSLTDEYISGRLRTVAERVGAVAERTSRGAA